MQAPVSLKSKWRLSGLLISHNFPLPWHCGCGYLVSVVHFEPDQYVICQMILNKSDFKCGQMSLHVFRGFLAGFADQYFPFGFKHGHTLRINGRESKKDGFFVAQPQSQSVRVYQSFWNECIVFCPWTTHRIKASSSSISLPLLMTPCFDWKSRLDKFLIWEIKSSISRSNTVCRKRRSCCLFFFYFLTGHELLNNILHPSLKQWYLLSHGLPFPRGKKHAPPHKHTLNKLCV